MKSTSFIFIIFALASFSKSIRYQMKSYPLFSATPGEFARVMDAGGNNIVFDPSKNRQFCALEIEWFNELNTVSLMLFFFDC